MKDEEKKININNFYEFIEVSVKLITTVALLSNLLFSNVENNVNREKIELIQLILEND